MTSQQIKQLNKTIKHIIKEGMFEFKGKPYVILTAKEHTELFNKARSYERIEMFVNMKDK